MRKRMLAAASAAAVPQDSNTAQWCFGAITAAISNAVMIGCLAAARSVILHGCTVRGLGEAVGVRAWTYITNLMEPVKRGRYPLGSCGAAATALVLAATVGDLVLHVPPSSAKRAASGLDQHVEQHSTWRLRRQCTLILSLILGMAELSALACTNWAAAYAAALVCVPSAIAGCKLLG